jgi:hypothetical protein
LLLIVRSHDADHNLTWLLYTWRCPCAVIRRGAQIFQDVLAESNTVAEEALTLSRVVRTFGTESTETRRYMSWLE